MSRYWRRYLLNLEAHETRRAFNSAIGRDIHGETSVLVGCYLPVTEHMGSPKMEI